jgi:hypothetical protein
VIKNHTGRRAFATTIALSLIALVAVALAAMTTRVATTARQNRLQARDAHIRQLLLAGTEIARAAPGGGEHDIELPRQLTDDGAKLVVRMKANQAVVEASSGTKRIVQVLTLDAGKVTTVRLLN